MRRQLLLGMSIGAILGIMIAAFGTMLVIHAGLENVRWGPRPIGYRGPGMMRIYGYSMPLWMGRPDGIPIVGFAIDPTAAVFPRPLNGRSPELSKDDVTNAFASWLTWQGNPHLRVGNVVERNADTILVDIVTVDKQGLVQRFAVNRHNGAIQRSEG